MQQPRSDFSYQGYNLEGIHESISRARQEFVDKVNADIEKDGRSNIVPHLSQLDLSLRYQEQQTQLAIACELRQQNTILLAQYRWYARPRGLRALLLWWRGQKWLLDPSFTFSGKNSKPPTLTEPAPAA